MHFWLLAATMTLVGCSTLNVFKTGNDECRDFLAEGTKRSIDDLIQRELGQPGDRSRWNSNWNAQLFYIRQIGPESCRGEYKGPTGAEFVHYAVEQRRMRGLPDIVEEERNAGRIH